MKAPKIKITPELEVIAGLLKVVRSDFALDREEELPDDYSRLLKKHPGVLKKLSALEGLAAQLAEKEKQAALSVMRAAYNSLPKHQQDILDNMGAEEILEEICEVDEKPKPKKKGK